MVKDFTVKKCYGVLGAYDNSSGQLIYGGSTNEGGINSLDWSAVIQAAIDHVDVPGTVTVEGIDFKFFLDNGVVIPDGVTVYEKFLRRKTTYTQDKGEGHHHVAGDISSGTLGLDRIPSHSSAKHTESYSPLSHYHPCAELTDHGKTLHDLLDIDAATVEGVTVSEIRDHDPKGHEHVESEITDLVHDAVKIKGKEVDDSGIGDGKKLGYNATSGKIEYQTGGGGGMEVHGNEYHSSTFLSEESDPSVDSSLKGVTKTQVQDHDPKAHVHSETEVTNLVSDLAAKETPSGAQAKVDAHKDLGTGVHGVGSGTVAKVGDIAVDSNLSSPAQDAISKKHFHSNQTLLDSYIQTEANLADAVTKKHNESHTLSSHSTKAHNELTDIGENDHHTKFTTAEQDVTARHTLGTIVPHDALASLTEKSHTNLTDKGTNLHSVIDSHLASTANPHATTKAQVALTNVTDDAQLKRADGDLNSFTLKATPVSADILLIEDSAAAFAKKKITVGTLPSGGGVTPKQYNQSTAVQSGFAVDTYVNGSSITIPANSLKIGTRYHFIFDVSKSAAGIATPTIIIRFGTAGAIGDAAILTFTFLAQTGVADIGTFEVWVTFRVVGASAIIQGVAQCRHRLQITGLQNLVCTTLQVTSGTFNSSVASSKIGVSVNGGTSAVWTVQLVQAELENLV